MNAFGVVAALTNFAGPGDVREARSRGDVTMQALVGADADEGVERVLALVGRGPVRPFQLVVSDVRKSVYLRVVDGGQERRREIADRVMILTNRFPPGAVELPGIKNWAEDAAVEPSDVEARLDHMVVTLATGLGIHMHTGERIPVCVEDGERRTVSGSIIAVPEDATGTRFRYCTGSPRTGRFRDYSGLARRLREESS